MQVQKGSAKFNKVRRGSTCVQVRTEPMGHPEHPEKVRVWFAVDCYRFNKVQKGSHLNLSEKVCRIRLEPEPL